MGGPLWTKMQKSIACSVSGFNSVAIPDDPGVYAWYKSGKPMYVGKAKCLANRLRKNHLRTSRAISNSAFRRNVAEALGIALANDLKLKRHILTEPQLELINRWIGDCEIGWLICKSHDEAKELERQMKAEFKPMLTKQ